MKNLNQSTKSRDNQVDRVIAWNSARYAKEYDTTLALKLLREETLEGMLASDSETYKIDLLDSAGDMLFVAIGVLWKVGLLDSAAKRLQLTSAISAMEIDLVYDLIDVDEYDPKVGVEAAAFCIELCFALCFELCFELLPRFTPLDLLAVICTSNETKDIPSEVTDATEKANIVKGMNYVGPEVDLALLLAGMSPLQEA